MGSRVCGCFVVLLPFRLYFVIVAFEVKWYTSSLSNLSGDPPRLCTSNSQKLLGYYVADLYRCRCTEYLHRCFDLLIWLHKSCCQYFYFISLMSSLHQRMRLQGLEMSICFFPYCHLPETDIELVRLWSSELPLDLLNRTLLLYKAILLDKTILLTQLFPYHNLHRRNVGFYHLQEKACRLILNKSTNL